MANPNLVQEPGLKGWIDYRIPVFSFLDKELSAYPTPKNLSYWWNFGSLAGICLVIMILSGIFLAMNYASSTELAFDSVERIMRDVNGGWLVRYIHMNGASMFFVVVYIHMFRGLYYGSYKPPREILWGLGVLILLLMMATAFMGYVLPWGQMSLWGAEVITNFFSAVPVVGDGLTAWVRGGFSVDNATLTRFFALHYLMPFLIVGVVILHLVALHQHGSNNPLGIDLKAKKEKIPFHPYYTIKDLYGLGVFLLVYCFFIFYAPNYLGHPDNYIPANPMVTPAHIVPEWYFLPFYAILRAVDFDVPLWPLGLAVAGIPLIHAFYVKHASKAQKQFTEFLFIFTSAFMLIISPLLAPFGVVANKKMGPILSLMFMVLGAAIAYYFFDAGVVINSKLGGVLAMFGSIAILFVLPALDTHPVRSSRFRPWHKKIYWVFAINAVVLGFCGAKGTDVSVYASFTNTIHAAGLDGALGFLKHVPMIIVGQLATAYYFAHFLVVLPFLSKFEPVPQLPTSIDDPVLPENKNKAAAAV